MCIVISPRLPSRPIKPQATPPHPTHPPCNDPLSAYSSTQNSRSVQRPRSCCAVLAHVGIDSAHFRIPPFSITCMAGSKWRFEMGGHRAFRHQLLFLRCRFAVVHVPGGSMSRIGNPRPATRGRLTILGWPISLPVAFSEIASIRRPPLPSTSTHVSSIR
jgi:hypothetical protein